MKVYITDQSTTGKKQLLQGDSLYELICLVNGGTVTGVANKDQWVWFSRVFEVESHIFTRSHIISGKFTGTVEELKCLIQTYASSKSAVIFVSEEN